MIFAPLRKRPATFAFVECKFFIDRIESPNRHFHGFDHCCPPAPAIQHNIAPSDLRARGTVFWEVS